MSIYWAEFWREKKLLYAINFRNFCCMLTALYAIKIKTTAQKGPFMCVYQRFFIFTVVELCIVRRTMVGGYRVIYDDE